MCGRFVSASPPDELARYFGAPVPDETLEPAYNVAPTSQVYAVRGAAGARNLSAMRWGLVPFWAKDLRIGAKMINARSETLFDKPAFRAAAKKRRCLIPVDGFYEWAKVAGHKPKQPYYIYRDDGEPLVFAGIWETWTPKPETNDNDGLSTPIESCTILTCAPNKTMANIHNRMPVLLSPSQWDRWLQDADDPQALLDMLMPAPDGLLTMHPVTTAVNRVGNNSAELIAVDPQPMMPVDTPEAASE